MNTETTINNAAPKESYSTLFTRFLRFGLLAWGGPVAQIAMIRQELVEEGRWISSERFNRVLAVYQALPGPEAHELCVYFGMISRGRIGGFLAGLGFMLPGFVLMFALSWFYFSYGINSMIFKAMFYGCQAAVGALIIRAIHRIGSRALTSPYLWWIAVLSGIGSLLGIHFLILLIIGGIVHALLSKRYFVSAAVLASLLMLGSVVYLMGILNHEIIPSELMPLQKASGQPAILTLFYSGLRSGLLTFGGAYTVLPFLQHDAVQVGAWMTNSQFLDGIALSGIIPAPFIIFATFVGYVGGGPLGSLALTIGIFTPAFALTLIGHKYLEKVIENKALHAFNDGVTGGVIGLISATTIGLLRVSIIDLPSFAIFALSLFLLYRWKAKIAVVFIVLGAGILGLLIKTF